MVGQSSSWWSELLIVLCCAVVLLPLTAGTRCHVCDTGNEADLGRCYEVNSDTPSRNCMYGCRMKFIIYGQLDTDQKNARVIRSCGTSQSAKKSSCSVNRQIIKGVQYNVTDCECTSSFCNDITHFPEEELALDTCYSCDYYGNEGQGGRNLMDQVDCMDPSKETNLVYCPYGYCRKIFYERGDYQAIARACVEDISSIDLTCNTWLEEGIYHETCHCTGDKCNSAPHSFMYHRLLLVTMSFSSIVTGLLLFGVV